MAKSFYIILIALCIASNCFSQTASAIVSATITNPVGTGKLDDMDFGNFKTSSTAGSIELNSINAPKSAGGVKLGNSETSKPASFKITGSDYAYAITIPSEKVIVKRNGGKETMTVESFSITPVNNNDGNQQLAFGATLKVGASQLPGNYSPLTSMDVTVNYN